MIDIIFDKNAKEDNEAKERVKIFLDMTRTLETEHDMPIIIFQDGASKAYYIKSSLYAIDAAMLCDLGAKLDVENDESYRSNRILFLAHFTYQRMAFDAIRGREFNDIIVEYSTEYNPNQPLKVWGGQHRVNAIRSAQNKSNRYHGFKIYFNLNKNQRTEIALISNTNIAVSNDTFDRMIEETMFGGDLRKWCQKVGFLSENEDFPDVGSRSEKITVKKARSFITNYYLGKEKGKNIKIEDLDKNVYEPYLVDTGIKTDRSKDFSVDPLYERILKEYKILYDNELLIAGQRFLCLHNAQYRAVSDTKSHVPNNKGFRNKAFIESVLCGWSFVAGLLQHNPGRLENHYRVPKTSGKIPDPLNAAALSKYKHDKDKATYRGLGTRSSLIDRQRMAQLFLAKSLDENIIIDEKFVDKVVSQVVGLLTLSQGYSHNV